MNIHKKIEYLLAFYADLSESERTMVEQHINSCKQCASRLAVYDDMDRSLEQLQQRYLVKATSSSKVILAPIELNVAQNRASRSSIWSNILSRGTWQPMAAGLALMLCLAIILATTLGGKDLLERVTSVYTSPDISIVTVLTQEPSPHTELPASSVLSTPTPQQVAASPVQLPTTTPTPLPTVTPTPKLYGRYSADGTSIVVTPVPATPLVTCTTEDEWIACYDELLDMSFKYPASMGQLISTQLRKSFSTGFSYEYGFEYIYQTGQLYAGGRSHDFVEGRGPRFTDAEGFNGQPVEFICTRWTAAMCHQLSPGAVLIVILPQAQWLCEDAMSFIPIPLGMLVMDLPQHPLITGFAFAFDLVPREEQEAFRSQFMMYNYNQCGPKEQATLRTAMEQLQQDLQAGIAEPSIQQRYDTLIQIAESIQSSYIDIN